MIISKISQKIKKGLYKDDNIIVDSNLETKKKNIININKYNYNKDYNYDNSTKELLEDRIEI